MTRIKYKGENRIMLGVSPEKVGTGTVNFIRWANGFLATDYTNERLKLNRIDTDCSHEFRGDRFAVRFFWPRMRRILRLKYRDGWINFDCFAPRSLF